MSTATFSSDQSSRFIAPLMKYFFPGLSPDAIDCVHWMIRKSGHFLMYWVFGFLLFWGLRANSLQRWRLRLSVNSVILLAIFAMADEFHQSLVPSRSFLLSDVAIDIVGGIISQVVIAMKYKLFRNVKDTHLL